MTAMRRSLGAGSEGAASSVRIPTTIWLYKQAST